jgi:hypothetical protein
MQHCSVAAELLCTVVLAVCRSIGYFYMAGCRGIVAYRCVVPPPSCVVPAPSLPCHGGWLHNWLPVGKLVLKLITCFDAAFTIISVYPHTLSFHYICIEWSSPPSHHLYPQSSEESFFQGFGNYVCNLILCSNMIDADCTFLDFFSEGMVFDVQVFGSWSHFWYLCNFNCSFIVFKDFAMNLGWFS